jgi:hypothetical protein
MADSANDFSTLNGMFKMRYADHIGRVTPKCSILSKLITFDKKDVLGNEYNYPVTLSNEWGVTFAGGQEGLITLNSAVAAQMENAQLFGQSIYMQSVVTYNAAMAAKAGNEVAFDSIVGNTVWNLKQNAVRILEIELLYGQTGFGQVASSSSNTSTTAVLVMPASSFSAAIVSNLNNALINFYNGSSLISSGNDSIFTITSVSTQNLTITVTGTSTGITALLAALPGTLDIYLNGAYGTEMAGLKKIMQNTGTLFSIDASIYNLWQANTYTVSGQLTRGDLNNAVALAVGRGLDEDVIVLVNPITFADLNTTEAGSRVYPTAGGEAINGFDRIEFYSSNGKMKIVPHLFVKQGDAFILPVKTAKRIGSTDWTFNIPGAPDGEFFLHLPTQNGYVLRLFSNQALILEEPAKTVYISGIVN